MNRGKKRAIMGIGTLIIFIATILVAAVAAGVLISTSGVLQQRALITGQEARKKITNAVEIISVVAYGNKTDETLNNFEILVRLDAGSDPMQMKKFDVSFIGEDHDSAGNLQHSYLNNPSIDEDGFDDTITLPLLNNTIYNLRDLDNDGIGESMYLDLSNDTQNLQYLIINFSKSGVGDFEYEFAEPTSYPYVTNQSDVMVIANEDNLGYGFLQIDAELTSNLSINSSNSSFRITANAEGECSFSNLKPETKYCFFVMHGDNDQVLGDGEVFEILYKLRHENRVGIGEEFRFIFSSEKGRLTTTQARTPDIIQTNRVPLWPVG